VPELLTALGLLLAGGLGAIVLRSPGWRHSAGQAGAIGGALVGLEAAVRMLVAGRSESITAAWPMPGGSLHLAVDALSAFFLLPVFGLTLAAALYGRAYLAGREAAAGAAAGCWFNLNLLTFGMALVVVAHDGLLFLLAWEVMALAPFFLVVFDDRTAAVRHAGWTYLAATHLGTAFLLVLFVVLGGLAGSSDFGAYAALLRAHPELASPLFLLAVIGFGAKAGIVPAHVWLPEAHPAAPSHASALMSGAMIKIGVYGILRMLTMLGPPPAWWGWLLLALGASSGILGVLFALAQHDLKRLLAYHSVENIGIILIGIGAGVIGLATGTMPLAVIGFAAGLLHVLNHSIFKGLLFLGAGAVQHAAHTLDIEELGGLLKRMPWTGATFLIGSAAIVGLPPFNGFVSEFLLFLAGFSAVTGAQAGPAAAGLATIVVMGLISGLAAACFAKAFGIVFLGTPRSREAAEAHEAAPAMIGAMAGLAALCLAIGLAAPAAVLALQPVVAAASGLPAAAVRAELVVPVGSLGIALSMFAATAAVAALAWVWRKRTLARRGLRRGPVWGCGYLFPSARMQYTASSFAQPLTTQFRLVIRSRERMASPQGYFPAAASYVSDSGDPVLRLLFVPTFRWFDRMANRLNVIQHGHTHIYVLYLAATLLALLVWASF
jgi:hydrogenase-4 component B